MGVMHDADMILRDIVWAKKKESMDNGMEGKAKGKRDSCPLGGGRKASSSADSSVRPKRKYVRGET